MRSSTIFSIPHRGFSIPRTVFTQFYSLRNSSTLPPDPTLPPSTPEESIAPEPPIPNKPPLSGIKALKQRLHKQLVLSPLRETHDSISPTPSLLLDITLSKILPRECQNPHFAKHNIQLITSSKTLIPLTDRRGNEPKDQSITSPHLIPPGHHLVYFPPWALPEELLEDGTDTFHFPGEPYTRRLWAGGSLRFGEKPEYQLFKNGMRALCTEEVRSVDVRGKEGEEKIFVEVVRKIGGIYGESGAGNKEGKREIKEGLNVFRKGRGDPKGRLAVVEKRTLVFMRGRTEEERSESLKTRMKGLKAQEDLEPDFSFKFTPTPDLLFRFSALTFNAHRIHLDPEYCREKEGYPNLLVHGPLTMILMLSIIRSQHKRKGSGREKMMIKRLDYKNLAPLYVNESMRVCVKRVEKEAKTFEKVRRVEKDVGVDVDDEPKSKRGPKEKEILEPQNYEVWIENTHGEIAVKGTATCIPRPPPSAAFSLELGKAPGIKPEDIESILLKEDMIKIIKQDLINELKNIKLSSAQTKETEEEIDEDEKEAANKVKKLWAETMKEMK